MMQEANYAFELNVRLFSSFAGLLGDASEGSAPVALSLPTRSAFSKASTYAGRPGPPVRGKESAQACPFDTVVLVTPAASSRRLLLALACVAALSALLLPPSIHLEYCPCCRTHTCPVLLPHA